MTMQKGEALPEREDVDMSTDGAWLARWYREAEETRCEVENSVYAYKVTGTADEDWLHRAGRKISYLRRFARWVEWRMQGLGLPVPYLPTDPRCRELRQKDEVIRRLKARLREAGLLPEADLSMGPGSKEVSHGARRN